MEWMIAAYTAQGGSHDRETLHEIEHEAWSQRASAYDALFAAVSTQAIGGILIVSEHSREAFISDVAAAPVIWSRGLTRGQFRGRRFRTGDGQCRQVNYPAENFQVADGRISPMRPHS